MGSAPTVLVGPSSPSLGPRRVPGRAWRSTPPAARTWRPNVVGQIGGWTPTGRSARSRARLELPRRRGSRPPAPTACLPPQTANVPSTVCPSTA